MNSLKYFRYLAKSSPEVGDDYEGVLHINKATACIKHLDGGSASMVEINNELLKTIHMNDFAFCMFGINQDTNNFQFNEVQKSKMLGFGDTALIIKDSEEFYKRIQNALSDSEVSLSSAYCGFVNYYDETVDSAKIILDLMKGMHNVAFQKRKKYDYQQEFRFLVLNSDDTKNHMELDIGDISDISEVISSKDALGSLWKCADI